MQPHPLLSQSRMSTFVLLAFLGSFAWSTPVFAHAKGVIGYGYLGYRDPPRGFEEYCKFKETRTCFCKWANSTWFDTVDGCSNVSQEMAEKEAVNTCTILCMKAQQESGNNNTGGTLGRPGGSTGGGVVLEGAGTVAFKESWSFLAYVASSLEPVASSNEPEPLAALLAEQTAVPWVFLEGPWDQLEWNDPHGSAAFVQAFWSKNGSPKPMGKCEYAVQLPCPLEDVDLGDSIQVCSGEGEQDALLVAQTSCAPLRYNALGRDWRTFAVFGETAEGGEQLTPAATLLAVEQGQFLGFEPGSLEAIGPSEDWAKLAEELLERTQGNAVRLAGPPEFYAPK